MGKMEIDIGNILNSIDLSEYAQDFEPYDREEEEAEEFNPFNEIESEEEDTVFRGNAETNLETIKTSIGVFGETERGKKANDMFSFLVGICLKARGAQKDEEGSKRQVG